MTTKPNEREISNWIAGEFNKLFEAGGYPFEIARRIAKEVKRK